MGAAGGAGFDFSKFMGGKDKAAEFIPGPDGFTLHHEDTEDHKCFEASSDSKFATKGTTDSGPCPSTYSTVDKTTVVEQCPDGVTSIRYCNPINVTIETKGEAGPMDYTKFMGGKDKAAGGAGFDFSKFMGGKDKAASGAGFDFSKFMGGKDKAAEFIPGPDG